MSYQTKLRLEILSFFDSESGPLSALYILDKVQIHYQNPPANYKSNSKISSKPNPNLNSKNLQSNNPNKITAKKSAPNKSSIYRQLEALAKEKILAEIDLNDGLKRYELEKSVLHHHLTCNFCGQIECVEIDQANMQNLQNELSKKYQFVLESPKLELTGKCKKCQSKKSKGLSLELS